MRVNGNKKLIFKNGGLYQTAPSEIRSFVLSICNEPILYASTYSEKEFKGFKFVVDIEQRFIGVNKGYPKGNSFYYEAHPGHESQVDINTPTLTKVVLKQDKIDTEFKSIDKCFSEKYTPEKVIHHVMPNVLALSGMSYGGTVDVTETIPEKNVVYCHIDLIAMELEKFIKQALEGQKKVKND